MSSPVAHGYLRDINFRVWDSLLKTFKAPPAAATLTEQTLPTARATTNEYRIPEYTPISNQGAASTCVANAMIDGLEILVGVQRGKDQVRQLSRRHLYWLARLPTRTTQTDIGTYLHSAAWQLQTIGVAEEQYFSYSDKLHDLTTAPPLSMTTMASENRIQGLWRIMSTGSRRLDQIEAAVRADHPVAFGTTVSRAFEGLYGVNQVVARDTSTYGGGHAMLVTGVRRTPSGSRQFLLRNSWGEAWGQGGHLWCEQDLLDWTETQDLWILTLPPRRS